MSLMFKKILLFPSVFLLVAIAFVGCINNDKDLGILNNNTETISFFKEMDSLLDNNIYDAEKRLKKIEKGVDSLSNEELAYFYNFKIALHLKNDDFDSIPYYVNRAFSYDVEPESKDLQIRLNYNLGKYYRFTGDYSKSLEYTLKGLALSEGYKEKQIELYNNLGGIYFELSDFDLAMTYLKKSYDLAVETNDTRKTAIAYANLGNVYVLTGRIDEARNSLLDSYLYFEKIQDTVNIIKSLTSRSRVELLENNFDASIKFLSEAKELSLQTKDEAQLGLIYQHLGNVYRAKKQYEESIAYYKKAYAISDKKNVARDKMNALEGLSVNYNSQNKYKEANENLVKFYHIRDSIYGVKVRQKVEEFKWTKALDEQKFENDLLSKKIETEKLSKSNLTKTYIIIIILILMVIVFIWMLYQNNKKSLSISNLTNERLTDKIASEEILKRVQEERFQEELELRNKELISLNILILAKNKIFNEIENTIINEGGNPKNLLTELKNVIKLNRNQEHDWEKFKDVFEKTHPEFFEVIRTSYPQLSKTEIRVCSYIKINMPSTEICAMLNINQDSLNKTRYRIRKKLELQKSDDLDEFVKAW
ncbi:Tetratricopeptide repeat-containing protein [Myroides guanonis]|uniref:Tetratricopeptide repeat-containing protein n=2 Tax=Myroides guanonis TaxID=1150112 RepID=A0A1I3V0K1_9FLAO|nr:Tetratricopeptide repeat-containing protein [Myroides guanonis]